jgi:hypothetical protein
MLTCHWIAEIDAAGLDVALAGLSAPADHVLLFLPEAESGRVPWLQDACRARGIGLAGAIFPEILVDAELRKSGAVFVHLAGAPAPLLIEAVAEPEAVPRTAARLAAHVADSLPDGQPAALCAIFDALVPNIATHLDQWYLDLADRVGYFGVNAGNERFTPAPCLFDGERFIAGGVLLQLLPDHPGACLSHGYGVPEQVISATSTQGNCIAQIDWRPALDVYAELMRRQYGVEITRENFYNHAVHFPFGILRADGEVLVRIPVALDEQGQIFCVGEIPANSVLTLLDARSGSHKAPALLARELEENGVSCRDDDLILFYCAGRRMHMGEGVHAELADITARTGARHLYGALSLGEIGSDLVGGYPFFHNATLVGVPCRTA